MRYALALLTLLMVTGPALAGQDAAMVVDMAGPPPTWDSGPNRGHPVELMDFLADGDRLTLGPGTTVILNYFASSRREEAVGPGALQIGGTASGKTGQVAIKSTKVDYLPAPTAARVGETPRSAVVTMRDAPVSLDALIPLTLVDTAVRGVPLHFRWEAPLEVRRFHFVITDPVAKPIVDLNLDRPAYDHEHEDLPRGREFNWKAEAVGEAWIPVPAKGRFYLLTRENLNQVLAVERYIRDHYPPDSTEGRIALAHLYKKYELNDEAMAVFQNLHLALPRNSNIPRHMATLKNNYHAQP